MRDVEWHGRYFACLCPFHSDSKPSLLVYPDGAFCLGCRKRFPLASLLSGEKPRSSSDKYAPRDLLDFTRLFDSPETFALEAHEVLIQYPQQRWYLKERQIDEAVETLWLGWWDGWYTFPIKTEGGNIIGVMLRASPSIAAYYPTRKYVALPLGLKPCLYVPEYHINSISKRVFVPFGVIDAVTLNLLRIPAATPIYGQTAHPKLFEDIRKAIHIIPDRGEETTARMLASHLDWRGHTEALPYRADEKDPNDIYRSNHKRLQSALAY